MTTKQRIGKLAWWFTINAITYILAALGCIAGVGWAFGVFKLLTWVTFFVASIVVFTQAAARLDPTKKQITLGEMALPFWLDAVLEVILACVLAGTGHVFYGLLVLLNEFVFYIAYQDGKVTPAVSS